MNIEELKKGLTLARSAREIFEKGVKACKQASAPQHRSKLEASKLKAVRCVDSARKTIDAVLGGIVENTPFLDDLHPLFRDLLLLSVNPDEFKICLSRISSARKILRKIHTETRKMIMTSQTARETRVARRAFFGRTLSVLKSLDECLEKVKRAQEAFLRLPDLDTSMKTVVIAGAPNVGKSTLLRALTRAKPKVSPYPFTTKELIIGVLTDSVCRIQLVDTPGLLDTPLEKKSIVEKQAILAMRHIASAILFIVDPTELCGFPLEYQKAVHDQVVSNFPVKVIRVANKIDVATREQLERMVRVFGQGDFLYVSAEKRLNIESVVKSLRNVCMSEGG